MKSLIDAPGHVYHTPDIPITKKKYSPGIELENGSKIRNSGGKKLIYLFPSLGSKLHYVTYVRHPSAFTPIKKIYLENQKT